MNVRDINALITGGYIQVSRKRRLLSRLPPGMSGLDALATVDPRTAKIILDRANSEAASLYVNFHDTSENITLTEDEFEEYLVRTGRSSRRYSPLEQEAFKAHLTLEPKTEI